MDPLEKRIVDLREEIQNDEPHAGHFDRFEMKRKQHAGKGRVKWLAPLLSAAAVVVIGLFIFLGNSDETDKLTLSDISPEYAETEFFYTSTISQQSNKIYELGNALGTDNSIELLMQELKAYDEVYEQLCADLEATPNDERVINAMLVYYQTKLEITTKILNELKNKKKNIEDYENIDI